MNHPSIARVHDAGTTERGQPYFVMELVDGIDLIPLGLGAFAVNELLFVMEKGTQVELIKTKLNLANLYPSKAELLRARWSALRSLSSSRALTVIS